MKSTWALLLRRLYLLAVGSVLLSAGAAFLVARAMPPPPSPGIVRAALFHLGAVLEDPAARADELARLESDAGLAVSVYTARGRLVATNVEPALRFERPPFPDGPPPFPGGPPPFPHGGPPHGGHGAGDGLALPLDAPSGTHYVAVVAPPGPGALEKLAVLLAAVLAVLAVLAVPFAVVLARPLGELARATRAFGAGDVAARADPKRAGAFAELAHTFNEMAARVTASMKAERELLANVSHELRTPLARIRVALDLAAEGDAAAARESLGDIEGDLGELERLVDDVLTAARLESGAAPVLRRAPTEPRALVEEAARRFRTRHPQHVLAVDCAGALPAVEADAVLLRRALDNFLDNAGKYSEPGSEVTLRAHESGGDVVIVVEDRGIGVSEEDQARLFTPFFRAEKSRTRAQGGVGLGLALSRRIVEAHGGSVSLRSEPGHGTAVTVCIPAVHA